MKRAIVIGASSGMGRELAKTLSRDGYAVGAMARRRQLLEELRAQVPGELHLQEIDVADAEAAMGILSRFIDRIGPVDLIVISAGTGEVNDDLDWRIEGETIRTNVVGFAAMANVAMRHFIARGAGHLVGISSLAALRGGRESPAYNASKAFQANYLEGLRQKIRRLRLPITVTDVKPGFVRTAMAKGEGLFWVAPVDKAVRQIYGAIQRRSPHVYVTRRWRLVAWILKAMPASLYERL